MEKYLHRAARTFALRIKIPNRNLITIASGPVVGVAENLALWFQKMRFLFGILILSATYAQRDASPRRPPGPARTLR